MSRGVQKLRTNAVRHNHEGINIYVVTGLEKRNATRVSNVSNAQVHVYTEYSSNLQIRLLLEKRTEIGVSKTL